MPAPRQPAYDVMAERETAQSRKRLAFCGFLAPFTSALPSKVQATPSDGKVTSMAAPCFLATFRPFLISSL